MTKIMHMEMQVYMVMAAGIHYITMHVLMSMDILMFVIMLKLYGIFHHQICAHNHDNERNIKLNFRLFTK